MCVRRGIGTNPDLPRTARTVADPPTARWSSPTGPARTTPTGGLDRPERRRPPRALSRNPTVAGAAALVSAPKPPALPGRPSVRPDPRADHPPRHRDRPAASTAGAGPGGRHRHRPRALYTDELTVTRVRGVGNSGARPPGRRPRRNWPPDASARAGTGCRRYPERATAVRRWSARCVIRWPPRWWPKRAAGSAGGLRRR